MTCFFERVEHCCLVRLLVLLTFVSESMFCIFRQCFVPAVITGTVELKINIKNWLQNATAADWHWAMPATLDHDVVGPVWRQLSPSFRENGHRYIAGTEILGGAGIGRLDLTLHSHHQNDFFLKTGSGVSFVVEGQSHNQTVSLNYNFWSEKRPKADGTGVFLLTLHGLASDPICFLTHCCDQVSWCGKPMERSSDGFEMILLVRCTGFP